MATEYGKHMQAVDKRARELLADLTVTESREVLIVLEGLLRMHDREIGEREHAAWMVSPERQMKIELSKSAE